MIGGSVRIRLKINPEELADASIEATRRMLAPRAELVGIEVKGQTQQRFTDGGDSEVRWPDLWVNNQAAVESVTKGRQTLPARTVIADKAKASLARIDRLEALGKITATTAARRRSVTQARWRRARGLPQGGTADIFRGGEGSQPLLDTGALRGSITFGVEEADRGWRVEIGSPLDYAGCQQRGFTTPPGVKSYVPLTKAAQGGWRKALIPGYDYVIMQNVTVPPRPFLRFTDRDRREIIEVLEGAR